MQSNYEEKSAIDAATLQTGETDEAHLLRARSVDRAKEFKRTEPSDIIGAQERLESDSDDALNETATNDDCALDACEMFSVSSEKDLLEPTVYRFIEKGINLGFTLDLIISLLQRTPRSIDEEKFIENLILFSIQNDTGSNMADEDDDDCDEDYLEPDERMSAPLSQKLNQNINCQKKAPVPAPQVAKQPEFHSFNDYQQFKFNPMNTTKMNIQDIEFIKMVNTADGFGNKAMVVAKKSLESTANTKTASKASIKKQQDQEVVNQMKEEFNDKKNLRPIVIDGNDVALSRSDQYYSIQRIRSVAEYFEKRAHQIYLVIPLSRKEAIVGKHEDKELLDEMQRRGIELVVALSKDVGSRKIVCDDDILILKTADIKNAVVVSNDNFKKFIPDYKEIIEERVLMYTFIDDNFVPADDPLGKGGPTLDAFIRFKWFNEKFLIPCPFGKKCTFGLKCKYIHAERGTHQQAFKTAHQNVLETQARERELFTKLIKRTNGSAEATGTLATGVPQSKAPKSNTEFAQMLNNNNNEASINPIEKPQFTKFVAASQAKNANSITMVKRGVQGIDLQPKQQQKVPQKSPFDVESEHKPTNMGNNPLGHNWNPFSCSSELLGMKGSYSSGAEMAANSYFQQRMMPPQQERFLVARGFATKTPTEMFDFSQGANQQKQTANGTMKAQKPRLQKPMNQNTGVLKKEWQQPFNQTNFSNWTNTNNSNSTNSNRPVITNDSSKPSDKYTYFPSQNPSMSNMFYETSTLMQNTSNPFDNKHTKLNANETSASSFNHNLYSRLLRRLPEEKARWVMEAYKDETDEDTLVFLAEDKSFFD